MAACLAACCGVAASHAASRISLRIDHLQAPQVTAEGFTFDADLRTGKVSTRASRLASAGGEIGDFTLQCARLRLGRAIACEGLAAKVGDAAVSGELAYAEREHRLQARLATSVGEALHLSASTHPAPVVEATLSGARLQRLDRWLPADLPKVSGGTLSGQVRYAGEGIAADLTLDDVAFSDAAGTRAGEKLVLSVRAQAKKEADAWRVQGSAQHLAGEVFWQPLYVGSAGHTLDFAGRVDAERIVIDRLRASIAEVGELTARGTFARRTPRQSSIEWQSTALDLAALHRVVIKPMAAATVLAELDLSGRASVAGAWHGGALQRLHLALAAVQVRDGKGRLGVADLHADIPWVRDEATGARVAWQSATFYKVPLGAVRLPVALSPDFIELRGARIPLLDGTLEIDRLGADHAGGAWPIVIAGRIRPVSMTRLTEALGWPRMRGVLAAELPGMVYFQRVLTVNGSIEVRVFDGLIAARDLRVEEVLGAAPRLTADISARGLDLDLITRTFRFGRIEGRIDADLAAMELVNWRPVRLDARIESSPGDYRKRISQQAVQNISALGGAGAAAAIQRSVLRFFEEFGYQKLGVTCRLRASVCEMGGVEDAPQGYVLVKGGGIPAISVNGYNREVSWPVLIQRVQAAIESNEKPIIR
jgi:hypothetical protein